MTMKRFLKTVCVSLLLGLSVGLICNFDDYLDEFIQYTPIMLGVSLGCTVLGCVFNKK